MSGHIELVKITYQNVRGFYNATLPLENEKALIVGRNHAGKTSALLLLSWLINEADPDRLHANDALTEQECALLLPARSARHKARRISLTVRFSDGRSARAHKAAADNTAILRLGFRVSGRPSAFIQLGPARRDSGASSDPKAKALLSRIQEIYSVVHIPSARDAASSQFRDRFRNLYKDKLSERALHPGKKSGATAEYRKIVQTSGSLKQLATDLLDPLLQDLARSLPNGLLQSPSLAFKEGTERSVVDWIVDQVALKLITGAHDDEGVDPSSVGAGLQSVLDIAAASVILGDEKKKLIVAVEEPEAFLHPSLQRTIARQLLSGTYGYKTLVSTHSSILVEEAKYDQLLLAVDQKILVPKIENEPSRSEIHTALLNGQGAEMIFAASVLLVEGEGDRAFFEGLRRRLAKNDSTGRVDNLYVIQVGGKANFAPWLKLLHALNGGNVPQPYNYLIVPDGDAVTAVLAAFRESAVSIGSVAADKLAEAQRTLAAHDFLQWREDLMQANRLLRSSKTRTPLIFLEGDLEWAMFSNLKVKECQHLAEAIGVTFENKEAFIKRMGSKAIDGKGGDKKAPHLRKQVAGKMDFSSLSENVNTILLAWLENSGISQHDAKGIIQQT